MVVDVVVVVVVVVVGIVFVGIVVMGIVVGVVWSGSEREHKTRASARVCALHGGKMLKFKS